MSARRDPAISTSPPGSKRPERRRRSGPRLRKSHRPLATRLPRPKKLRPRRPTRAPCHRRPREANGSYTPPPRSQREETTPHLMADLENQQAEDRAISHERHCARAAERAGADQGGDKRRE